MKIFVVDQKGTEHAISAKPGWTAMEALRDASLPIRAECGGACSCATCHVYVNDAWREKVNAASELEVEMLDIADTVKKNSRLACQITLEEQHDGMMITLAPGTEP